MIKETILSNDAKNKYIKISKYIKARQLHFLVMLTGREVEKQIEGWKNRNTWSPHKDPDPIWTGGRNCISKTKKNKKEYF